MSEAAAVGAAPMGAVGVGAVGVVVPVADEEDHLEACLASVMEACERLGFEADMTAIVVALDGCSDASPAIARRMIRPGAGEVLVVSGRNVGAARAAGVDALLRRWSELEVSTIWLATTDADTVVPPGWLVEHLRLADAGVDGVAGTVEVLDWGEHAEEVPSRFRHHYEGPAGIDDHPHVHGANLGVRASAYRAVGGFPAVPVSEDHALWGALRAAGLPLATTRRSPVATSARREGRARGGFADFLSDLA